MRKIFKRTLATIMAILIVLTCVPLSGFVGMDWSWLDFSVKASAATDGYYTYNVSGDKATITDVNTSISGNVTIPSTLGGYKVKNIGNGAFASCNSLTSVTIPDSVTSIGDEAFDSCDSLKSVTIGDSVTSIGASAFYYCTSLTSVTIPDSVTSIGYRAFYGCNNLTSVTIGDSVKSIGDEAFYSCYDLTSVTIGDSVKSIGNYAFRGCKSLTNITIPDSVTSIGDGAFDFCRKLTSVTIPDSVISIGNGAFYDCYCLTSVTIGDSVTSIGVEAFWHCNNLTSVTIGDSVTSIGDRAFEICESLTSITIPDSVKSIGEWAFGSCKSLTSVTIGDGVTRISNCAFVDCESLTSVTIPDSVTSIGGWAFVDCDNLTSVTIPNSVTSIGESAFEYCPIKDVYYIGTKTQWKAIAIEDGNSYLTDATIHYSSGNYGDDSEEDYGDVGYKLRLRSDGAYSDSIAVGKEITFWTFLYNNGERENCNRAYAISFDTPGIFEVVKTKKTSSSFDVTLKACKAGTTNMTVSDSETGAYVTIRLKANNPVEVITMDEVKNLAKEYQKDKLTHFYDYNGLYVDSYSYRQNKDGSYNVGMTIYNEKAHHGAVVSYDKNGNIADYELIAPQDKLPTSLWDGLFDSFDLLNDLIAKYKDKYLYDEESFTKRTQIRIDDFNVPDGGYFVITNNYLENEYVFFANTINIAIDLICAYSKVNKVDVPDELPEKATEKVLEEIIKDLGPDQFKTVYKKLVKNFAKDLTISNVDVFMSGMVSTFKEFEINIEEIIKDTLEDLKTDTESHLDFAEDMVLTLFGAAAIKTALSSLGYINTVIKLIDVFSSSLAPEIAIYTPPEKDTIRTSNGVSVTSETPLTSDYVLHSYVIKDTSDVMTEAKPTLDELKSSYQVCDITLYKSSQAVQPDAKITVMIPIPTGYNKDNIQVFWYKDDGTLQSMNAVVKGDYAVFETDHLSYYVLVEDHKCTYEEVTVTAATYGKAGVKAYKCVCGKTEKTEPISAVKSITLSKTNYIYDGKNKTPTVTVKDANGKKLVKNTDYKLSVASKRSGIGRYTVKVTLIGNYSGTKSVYFYIKTGKPATVKSASQTTSSVKLSWSAVPGAAGYTVYRYSPSKKAYVKAGTTEGTSFTVKSLYAGTKYTFRVVSYGKTTAGKVYDSDSYALLKTATKTKTPTLSKVTASSAKGKAVITHTNVSGETGYTVYYSTKKDSGFKKYANFKADTTTCNITGLTSGKTYYFKVRTYITTDSGYVYSAWSDVKSIKITVNYYVTKTGTKYHVDGCSSLNKSKISISYKDAVAKGYKACDKCIK